MGASKEPFHTKDYTYNKEKNRFDPLLEVLVGSKELKKKVIAYVDTGCTTCMHFCKSDVDMIGLTLGKKINKEPVPFLVADGHTINGDYYKAICEIDGEEKEIGVSVIDPEKFWQEGKTEIRTVMPLIGIGVLNNYDTIFKGRERKILLFHPVDDGKYI